MSKRIACAAVVLALIPCIAAAGSSPIAIWSDTLMNTPGSSLKQDASAKAAWHRIVPKKFSKLDWVRDLFGNADTPKIETTGGVTYVHGGVCKPHDCGDNHVYYVIEPGGHRAAGVMLLLKNNQIATQEYFGDQTPMLHEWLREAQLSDLHALGYNGPLK